MSLSVTRTKFFGDIPITNDNFNQVVTELGFRSTSIILVKIGIGDITFSFNGTRIDGILDDNVKSVTMDNMSVSKIWFKKTGVDSSIRIWAWARENE